MTDQQFHALRVAREITGYPTATEFRLTAMAAGESWPIMNYRPVPGVTAGSGLTRNEAIRLLSAMLLDITEMPDYAR